MLRLRLPAVVLAAALVTVQLLESRYDLPLMQFMPLVGAVCIVGIFAWRWRSMRRAAASAERIGLVQDDALVFQPVWLSSREHLRQFDHIVEHRKRLFGWLGFHIPDHVPHLRFPVFGSRVPLILQALGSLEVRGGRLQFRAESAPQHFGNTWYVDAWRSFDIALRDIDHVSSLTHTSSAQGALTMTWVRLRGETADAEFDVLLALGGVGAPLAEVRARTQTLRDALEREIAIARDRSDADHTVTLPIEG